MNLMQIFISSIKEDCASLLAPFQITVGRSPPKIKVPSSQDARPARSSPSEFSIRAAFHEGLQAGPLAADWHQVWAIETLWKSGGGAHLHRRHEPKKSELENANRNEHFCWSALSAFLLKMTKRDNIAPAATNLEAQPGGLVTWKFA